MASSTHGVEPGRLLLQLLLMLLLPLLLRLLSIVNKHYKYIESKDLLCMKNPFSSVCWTFYCWQLLLLNDVCVLQ